MSELGSQNDSKIEPKSTLKSVSGDFVPKRRTLRKHPFLLSQTHIWHLLGSTISSRSPLRNTARNALEKRLTKERNKTLVGSIFGGNGLKMCPKMLPIELPSRFMFLYFFKLFAMTGSWDLRLTPEPHEGLKMSPRGTQNPPRGAKNGPCRSQNPANQQPAQAPRSKEHKEPCISP